jgi:hypothetical protein
MQSLAAISEEPIHTVDNMNGSKLPLSFNLSPDQPADPQPE